MKSVRLLLLPLLCGLLCQCHHWKIDPKSFQVKEVLPAETQEGKNTFGCYVNGRLYLPKGGPLFSTPNLNLSYDAGFDGGTMSLKATRTYRNPADTSVTNREYMAIAIGRLSQPGEYSLDTSTENGVGAYSLSHTKVNVLLKYCNYDHYEAEHTGKLTITKLDKQNGIVSGRFEFTLRPKTLQAGCDSVIRVTKGRFDMRM